MSNKNDLLNQRLKEIVKDKNEVEGNKPGVVNTIVTGEEEKPDFMKMAAELEAQKEERVSENLGYTKDTIYIRDDLFQAMQALCAKQGDKKKFVNQAYEEFLTKKYKELSEELNIDK